MKYFFNVLAIVILGYAAVMLPVYFASKNIQGFELFIFDHCGDTSGFPFISHGGGNSVQTKEAIVDCFPTVDPRAYVANVLLFLMIFYSFYYAIYKKLDF